MPPVRMPMPGKKAKNPGKTMLRLLSYMKKYVPVMVLVLICIFINTYAQTTGSAVDHTGQKAIAVLHIQQHHTQNSAIGGDQGQEHAQRLIQCRYGFFQEHLHHLHDGGDHQNKHHGLHVSIGCAQQQIHRPACGRGQRHNKGNGHAMPNAVSIFLETPMKGQIP